MVHFLSLHDEAPSWSYDSWCKARSRGCAKPLKTEADSESATKSVSQIIMC
jgi:hypothetical protein